MKILVDLKWQSEGREPDFNQSWMIQIIQWTGGAASATDCCHWLPHADVNLQQSSSDSLVPSFFTFHRCFLFSFLSCCKNVNFSLRWIKYLSIYLSMNWMPESHHTHVQILVKLKQSRRVETLMNEPIIQTTLSRQDFMCRWAQRAVRTDSQFSIG